MHAHTHTHLHTHMPILLNIMMLDDKTKVHLMNWLHDCDIWQVKAWALMPFIEWTLSRSLLHGRSLKQFTESFFTTMSTSTCPWTWACRIWHFLWITECLQRGKMRKRSWSPWAAVDCWKQHTFVECTMRRQVHNCGHRHVISQVSNPQRLMTGDWGPPP